MKTKHLMMILSGIFLINVAFSQNDHPLRIYSEVTSHLRGNRSTNLSFEVRNNKHYFGMGFDHIYANHHPNRTILDDHTSWGANFKYSIDLMHEKKPDFLQAGVYLKYSRIYLESIERESFLFTSDKIYQREKEIQKIVPMGFVQMNFLRSQQIFLGCQFAVGFLLGNVIESKTLSTNAEGFENFGEGPINFLYEHGVYDTHTPVLPRPMFQFNLLVGYEF